MLVTTITALLAAALFGVSTAFQHRSAALVSDGPQASERLGRFMAKTLSHPLWIIGAVADLGGFGLHALALRLGPLTVVQPVLVSSIVFAVVLRQLLERRWPRRDELTWATALTLGLVLFLSISTPAGHVAQRADPVPAAVVGALIGLSVLGFFAGGRRYSGSAAAALLGTAAGLSYAALAGLLKQDMVLLKSGVGVLAASWPLYALIAVGAFSLVVTQLAYRAGPLSSSLPTIMTVDALVSLVIGASVFDEGFRNGAADILGEAAGLALLLAGAVGLTRSGPEPAGARGQSPFPVARCAPRTGVLTQ
ncbi:MAG TPA: DMT family transporter [Acidimicrobiales bacterium]|nr:DMT family transporter [Acidimicrobiales bacterium]